MTFDEHLRIEQAKALFASINFILIGTFGISLLITVVLWDYSSKLYLLAWLVVSILIVLSRWIASRKYDPDAINTQNVNYWLNQFTCFAFLSGFNWGLIPILFFTPDHPFLVLFVASIYTGYLAIALSSNALYFPAFLAFSIPSTLLFFIENIIQSQIIYTSVAIMVVFFFVVMFVFAKNFNNIFVEGSRNSYERNKLIDEITKQKETAERAVDAKNQFLAAASHDLRQPLHALGLFIDALEPHVKNTHGTEILGKISQSKKALNGLLHGLLDISRLDAKVVESYPQNIAVSSIIEPIIEEYSLSLSNNKVLLRTDLSAEHIVFIDPVLIERVLRNLLDNAFKYTPNGEIRITSKETEDSMINICVADNGIGIPIECQEMIFVEFNQLNNPERDRKKGLGLGLSIVKRLCELMQINFTLESEVNQGTSFNLNLPRGSSIDKINNISEIKELLLKGLNIVVIDDEKDILDGMNILIKSWGCHVILAQTVDEALKSLHKTNELPDIIIADYRLTKNRTGIEAIEIIREEYNENIKAIIITGDIAEDILQQTHSADVLVLHKPVEAEMLYTSIQSLMSLKIKAK